jgi:hypothetical protein
MHDMEVLRLQAGHDHAYTGLKYFGEAGALALILSIHNDPKQRLGTFRPIFSAGSENGERSNRPGRQWQKPLPEIARGFVEAVVGVDPYHPEARSIRYLYGRVTAWRHPTSDPDKVLNDLINESFSDDKRLEFRNAIDAATDAAVTTAKSDIHLKTKQGCKRLYDEFLSKGIPQVLLHGIDIIGMVTGVPSLLPAPSSPSPPPAPTHQFAGFEIQVTPTGDEMGESMATDTAVVTPEK